MGWFVSNKKENSLVQDAPEIIIKSRLKKVELVGFSRMTNPGDFYNDLIRDMEDYFKEFGCTLILDIKLEYINTASGKWLFVLFSALEAICHEGGLIEINWYYEEDDETIQESGEIYKGTVNLPFHLKEIE